LSGEEPTTDLLVAGLGLRLGLGLVLGLGLALGLGLGLDLEPRKPRKPLTRGRGSGLVTWATAVEGAGCPESIAWAAALLASPAVLDSALLVLLVCSLVALESDIDDFC